MIRVVLLWGLLLLSGIFLVNSYEGPSNSTTPTKTRHAPSNVTTHAPSNATTHAPSNATTHAPSNATTHAPSNATTHAPSNATTHAPSNATTPAPSNVTTHAPSNVTTHAPSNVTTHAPSNVTTHAPSNVTTHAPSNATTHAPSNATTHAPSNATTHAPSNVTTHVPSNVTTHATTQPIPTLPTKPSPPSNGNYSVQNGKDLCIIADMGLSLELNLQKGKRFFDVDPTNTHSNGTCGESKANLFLSFHEGSINFAFVKENNMYYISEVSVTFTWESSGHWNSTATKLQLLSTPIGYSVKCKNTPTVNLGDDLQLTMVDVKLQAFDIQNWLSGKETVCSYDRNVIVVAVAVTVLIVIIIAILIYVICHKKRSSGYQRI